MNKPNVFVQIYAFHPTFGRKVMSFCPNLYFLPHIWTKTLFLLYAAKLRILTEVRAVYCNCRARFL